MSIYSLYQKFLFKNVVRKRYKYIQPDLNKKISNIKLVSLSKSQISDFKRVWGGVKPNKWIEFYNSIPHEGDICMYCPDDFFYCYIDQTLSDPKVSVRFDDKNFYDFYFKDVAMPSTVVRKMDGNWLDSCYSRITLDDAFQLCSRAGKVIIKPAINMAGGKGIYFWSKEENDKKDFEAACGISDIIIQEIVTQHEQLAAIHPYSINSVRIMTLLLKGESHVLSAVLRMGVNGKKVDNVSSGGIAVGILPDGRLKDFAFDNSGTVYKTHPQGVVFGEHYIPNIEECKELVKKLSYRMSRVSKLISWDLCIGKDGHPMLIEANCSWGELDFHQMCNGPIFKDKKMINTILQLVQK